MSSPSTSDRRRSTPSVPRSTLRPDWAQPEQARRSQTSRWRRATARCAKEGGCDAAQQLIAHSARSQTERTDQQPANESARRPRRRRPGDDSERDRRPTSGNELDDVDELSASATLEGTKWLQIAIASAAPRWRRASAMGRTIYTRLCVQQGVHAGESGQAREAVELPALAALACLNAIAASCKVSARSGERMTDLGLAFEPFAVGRELARPTLPTAAHQPSIARPRTHVLSMLTPRGSRSDRQNWAMSVRCASSAAAS